MIPEGFTNRRPNVGGGDYISEDGRFRVQRYSSNSWMLKDLDSPGPYGPKIVARFGTLMDAPVEIEHYLREEKERELGEAKRQARIKSVAHDLRGVTVMGAVNTNEPNYEGEDAADYVERLFGKHSQTAGFTLADLERIIKHVKGDQYRGPG